MVKIYWEGIEWRKVDGEEYYLYWWNWLPRHLRYWGPKMYWYDGPRPSFGLWFTNVTWLFPWTPWKE